MTSSRPVTPAQAAARAENGRRYSSGPKTHEGKEASSRNALKHGGYATATPVIPSGPLAEDANAFEAFRTEVLANLGAEGAVEVELANTVATLMWRNRRPAAYEARYLGADHFTAASDGLHQATQLLALYEVAATVLGSPEAQHNPKELEAAAIATGHAVGLCMDDDWPQPNPTDQGGWNDLIDSTLATGHLTRAGAIRYCEQTAAAWEARAADALAEHHAVHVARVLDEDLLMKTARVEAHIGRELSRSLNLLRALQAARAETRTED